MTQTPADPYDGPKAVPVPDTYRVPPRVAASTTWRCRECGTKLQRTGEMIGPSLVAYWKREAAL